MARGGHRGARHTLRLFETLGAFGAAAPSRLGDHGAVAIEFSLIFPVMLLMFAGIFGMGVVMIEDMQLTFVVQGAAKLEAAKAGTGVPWANAQLSPPASFTARQPGAGAMQRRTDHRTVAD